MLNTSHSWSVLPTNLDLYFCATFLFLVHLFASLSLSSFSLLSALMQQSRKGAHLSALMAAGGAWCSGGGGAAWSACLCGFRLLPCRKVIVIKPRLTVVNCASEVQMSFASILKSPLQRHLLMRSHAHTRTHKKTYPTPNIRLCL